jgi:hypothetical protein
MKMKPGTLAAQGGLAAAAVLLSACVTTGECTPAPTAEQTPAVSAGAAAPAPASAYSVPAAGGTPQASPAVPPPDYNAPPPAEALSAPVDAAPPDVSLPDNEVVTRVRSALATHNTTRGLRVGVSAHDGVVKLTGSVPSSVQVDQVESVVTDVQGVREVNNLLKVGSK